MTHATQLDARLRDVESRVEIAGILVGRIHDRLSEIEEIMTSVQLMLRENAVAMEMLKLQALAVTNDADASLRMAEETHG